MTTQQLLSYVRKACEDYNMIQDGDKIAVGISGGKDSLTTLIALSEMKRFYPKHYDITAITVSLGFGGFDIEPVKRLCEQLGVRYDVIETDIGHVVFEERKEKNPCSLCAKMRKGALNTFAKELGCNKIAYGHNKDDVLHTFMMSLFYEGRINTFTPVTYLDRQDLYTIRPLIYVPEDDVRRYVKSQDISIIKSPCPADGYTKREEARVLLGELRPRFENLDTKLFGAIARGLWRE